MFSTMEPRSWPEFLHNFFLIITIITTVVFIIIIIIINNYTESSQVIFILTATNHPEVHRVLVCLIFSTVRYISKMWTWNYISFFHEVSYIKNRRIKKLESGIVHVHIFFSNKMHHSAWFSGRLFYQNIKSSIYRVLTHFVMQKELLPCSDTECSEYPQTTSCLWHLTVMLSWKISAWYYEYIYVWFILGARMTNLCSSFTL